MTTTGERASIFGDEEDDLDLSGFAPRAPSVPRPNPEVIREIAEKRGFQSREPAPAVITPAAETPSEKPLVRRRRTGRHSQVNLRTTAEVLERFKNLADLRGLTLAEAFEAAVDLLEADEQ